MPAQLKLSRFSSGLKVSLIAISLFALSGQAAAQSYGRHAKNSIIGSLTPAEQASFGQASAKALNDQRDGVTTLWQSPSKKRGAPSAQLRADNSSAASRPGCRTLHSQFERAGVQESWQFLMCKQADGKWKVVSN